MHEECIWRINAADKIRDRKVEVRNYALRAFSDCFIGVCEQNLINSCINNYLYY